MTHLLQCTKMLVSYKHMATMAKQTGLKSVWDGNRGVDEGKKQEREEDRKTKYNHPLLAHTINQSINQHIIQILEVCNNI